MLSRVAENLYWLGRYAERAENTARIVNVNAHLLLDLPKGIAPGWEPLIAISGNRDLFTERHASFEERDVVRFLLADRSHSGSVLSSLAAARENARTVRDVLPRQAWEVLNELYHRAADGAQSGVTQRGRHGYVESIVRGVQTLSGLLLGTMNHGVGYQFLTLGRVLERGDMTTRIVDVRSSSLLPDDAPTLRPFEAIQWRSVLRSLSGYQMYRQTMHATIRRRNVIEFLFRDREFPRSVGWCILVLQDRLGSLPNNDVPRRVTAGLQGALARADVDALAASNEALHAFVDELQLKLAAVHDAIAASWFLPVVHGQDSELAPKSRAPKSKPKTKKKTGARVKAR